MNKGNNNNSGGGCLITCLKAAGILVILSLILGYGWIVGLIWLIFFRKKMADNPKKQQGFTIGVSIASVISFLIFIYSVVLAPPSPTALTLISTVEGTELDINTDYQLSLQYEPADATLSNVKFKVDNPIYATITPNSDNTALTLHTNSEGIINITAYVDDIESNILTFEIIDKERIAAEEAAAEQKRLEEEKAAKEAEEKRLAEEAAAKEAEEKMLAEEKVAAEAEAQQLAEEQAAKETENQSVDAGQTSGSETTTSVTSSGTDEKVWIDNTGKKYHSKSSCSNMDAPYEVSEEEAESMGRTACKKCY